MANIADYIKWRNDVPLSVDTFNEVDNLIFAELSYIDFNGIAEGEPVELKTVRDSYFQKHSREEVEARTSYSGHAPFLMDYMLEGDRFAQTKVAKHINIVDSEKNMQLSATTFLLSDGSIFVAFRGTDSTIAGWREDMDFCYMDETEGQKNAVKYLEDVATAFPGGIRVGGHSKGGNFAVYASAFCREGIQKRITKVYSDDGPGFREEILATAGYQNIKDRVIKIIPDTSIVGMMLSDEVETKVVPSTANGIAQHNGYTWQLEKNAFERAELSDFSVFVKESTDAWLSQLNDAERAEFVSSLFIGLKQAGIKTFAELVEDKKRMGDILVESVRNLPKEKSEQLNNAFKKLIQASGKVASDNIKEKALVTKDKLAQLKK